MLLKSIPGLQNSFITLQRIIAQAAMEKYASTETDIHQQKYSNSKLRLKIVCPWFIRCLNLLE